MNCFLSHEKLEVFFIYISLYVLTFPPNDLRNLEFFHHFPHFTNNPFTMMWKTKKIYTDFHERKILPDPRFNKGVPEWQTFDKIADNMATRVIWGLLYVAFYVLCISIWELPGTHWVMYFLLPIHFVMGPLHGAIVNWSGHKYGYRNFDTEDHSKNSLFFDFVTLGELFQNNHHKLPARPNFGVKWWEMDPTYPFIKFFHYLGIIKLKKVA